MTQLFLELNDKDPKIGEVQKWLRDNEISHKPVRRMMMKEYGMSFLRGWLFDIEDRYVSLFILRFGDSNLKVIEKENDND